MAAALLRECSYPSIVICDGRPPKLVFVQMVTGDYVGMVTSSPNIGLSDLPDDLRVRLESKVARLGYLGEFFQVGAQQPQALAGFIDFTEALKDALPDRLVEVIALTIAAAAHNGYERVQHERLALKVGMSEREVRALVERGPSAEDGFDELELATVALAVEVVEARGSSCADSYQAVVQLAGLKIAVGCLMTATRYLAHSTMANTWGLRAPVASPLAEHSDA